MKNSNIKIELHILQNFPPSNLNRDDSGMPKDCEFGGVRRARISSQCLKRSIRYSKGFQSAFQPEIGVRTKLANDLLCKALVESNSFDENTARLIGETVLSKILGSFDKDKTAVLFYTDNSEIEKLAQIIITNKDNFSVNEIQDDSGKPKKSKEKNDALGKVVTDLANQFIKSCQNKIGSVDIALFGRMLANEPRLSIDAACQVAHAISVNRVSMDFDYFTALDDLSPDEEQGAGMIGTIGFNSACFYRYSSIDFNLLNENLDKKSDLAIDGVLGFIKGSVEAVPTGKQNSFAALTVPSFVMIEIKENQIPMSLANAFEKPVSPKHDKSLSELSVKALADHWLTLKNTFNQQPKLTTLLTTIDTDFLGELKDFKSDNVEILLNKVKECLIGIMEG